MKALNLLYYFFAMSAISLLGSCVSTETIEPENDDMASDRIVLNLGAPRDLPTRAADHSDHKLRFIAKLYRYSGQSYYDERRKELLLGDRAADADRDNQIIFDVPAGNTYAIFLYADYIPSDAVKDSNGEYGDYYYDTHTVKERTTMYTTPKTSETILSTNFFNNDNYDFFTGMVTIPKGVEKEERDITLQRSVAKVRFVDTSNNAGNYGITASDLYSARFLTITSINENGAVSGTTTRSSSISLTDSQYIEPDENNESEILFYYAFANHGDASGVTNSLTLQLRGTDGSQQRFVVSQIPVKQNYITTVKGAFLPDLNNTPGGDEPDTGEGPIILNMSVTGQDWVEQTHEWN